MAIRISPDECSSAKHAMHQEPLSLGTIIDMVISTLDKNYTWRHASNSQSFIFIFFSHYIVCILKLIYHSQHIAGLCTCNQISFGTSGNRQNPTVKCGIFTIVCLNFPMCIYCYFSSAYLDKTISKDPHVIANQTADQLENVGRAREAAELCMSVMSSKDKEKWDAVIKKVLFEIGNHVKLTHEGRFGLEPQFKGPFIVMNKNNKYGTYQLKTMEGKPLASWVHVDWLYKTNGDAPNDTWYNPTAYCSAWLAAMTLLDTKIPNDAVDPVASPDDIGAHGQSQSQEGIMSELTLVTKIGSYKQPAMVDFLG
ncbi:hypothetical protein PHYBLDRAFT_176267 [Phycomyces blakesleeanus NRRL 1555(-)]|uniref:Uncharacterized protein n=1 Tax=Phycomyces blakesleeanus (strain ATCC 8743b / DSM 1359 / FGSC 10004 / NBRC 33097 / NRRL 1555) TaxID=763407 RepID=A0A162W8I9_PHYB8|nr:hypothetical protein PHYBLDRAFT_176267 [Phycomyces blakesleeanus NRRL 1555(-)]OAD65355.1 hypothetical protein PHYBLDRAFT_176267 [Phycomyces blakesleeanus NRRL 1555(-)]|eukprot:XP_018283395.1 hypothetical protein PHYBLDRAFT_176267 [Phycomyces blakesleeanus NRRL 1555(-)]